MKKRIEYLKNKKYERALVKENIKELKEEKITVMEKKKAEKAVMEKNNRR